MWSVTNYHTHIIFQLKIENNPRDPGINTAYAAGATGTVAAQQQHFFPTSMNVGILNIIRLLDDTSITTINSHSGRYHFAHSFCS